MDYVIFIHMVSCIVLFYLIGKDMDHILMYLNNRSRNKRLKLDKTNIIMFIRHNLLILSITNNLHNYKVKKTRR
jgi:hypothetical protein